MEIPKKWKKGKSSEMCQAKVTISRPIAAIFRLVGSWEVPWISWKCFASTLIYQPQKRYPGWVFDPESTRRIASGDGRTQAGFSLPYFVGYIACSSALLRPFFFVGIYSYFCLQVPQSGKFTWLPHDFFIKGAHPNYEQVILAPPRWSPPSGVFFSAMRHWFYLFGYYIYKLEINAGPWPLSAKNGKKVSCESLIRLRLREALFVCHLRPKIRLVH